MRDKFFAVILAIVVAGFAIFLWQKLRKEPAPKQQEHETKSSSALSNAVKITDSQNIADGQVQYKNGKFYPASIKITENSNCVLAVTNAGDKILKLGLSPHREKGDPGVMYGDTKPGKTILVDPRYRIERIKFHDHNNPEGEVEVQLEGRCKDF